MYQNGVSFYENPERSSSLRAQGRPHVGLAARKDSENPGLGVTRQKCGDLESTLSYA